MHYGGGALEWLNPLDAWEHLGGGPPGGAGGGARPRLQGVARGYTPRSRAGLGDSQDFQARAAPEVSSEMSPNIEGVFPTPGGGGSTALKRLGQDRAEGVQSQTLPALSERRDATPSPLKPRGRYAPKGLYRRGINKEF